MGGLPDLGSTSMNYTATTSLYLISGLHALLPAIITGFDRECCAHMSGDWALGKMLHELGFGITYPSYAEVNTRIVAVAVTVQYPETWRLLPF